METFQCAENKLIGNENGAYWCFCVRYIERTLAESGGEKDGIPTKSASNAV